MSDEKGAGPDSLHERASRWLTALLPGYDDRLGDLIRDLDAALSLAEKQRDEVREALSNLLDHHDQYDGCLGCEMAKIRPYEPYVAPVAARSVLTPWSARRWEVVTETDWETRPIPTQNPPALEGPSSPDTSVLKTPSVAQEGD